MTARKGIRVDQGDSGCPALGLCWCGARFLHTTRAGALGRLAWHEELAHPDVSYARDALSTDKRRRRKRQG